MGILEKIRSVFIKKQQTKQTTQSTNITRYDTSLITIPKYPELSDEDRKTVDDYISEVDMEKLDTLILYADEMSRYATANTDLLVKLFERITERPPFCRNYR